MPSIGSTVAPSQARCGRQSGIEHRLLTRPTGGRPGGSTSLLDGCARVEGLRLLLVLEPEPCAWRLLLEAEARECGPVEADGTAVHDRAVDGVEADDVAAWIEP